MQKASVAYIEKARFKIKPSLNEFFSKEPGNGAVPKSGERWKCQASDRKAGACTMSPPRSASQISCSLELQRGISHKILVFLLLCVVEVCF